MPELTFGVSVIVMKDRATVLLAKVITGNKDVMPHSVSPDAGKWAIPSGPIRYQESIRQAAIRTVKDVAGLEVEAKQSLFFCETVQPDDHRVFIFCLAIPTGGELEAGFGWEEVRWVDVRDLGRIQKEEGMSDFSAAAFVKFSEFLKTQATRTPMPVAPGEAN